MAVSSIDTLSTQSNSSPMGRLSRILAARSRISGSRIARFIGETAGLTVLRCTSCLGGSMAMNMGRGPSSPSWVAMVMPPSEEKTWWLVSTAMMSLYLVIDQ